MTLNKNDEKLLELCSSSRKSVNQLSREMNIAPSNISSRLKRLEESGLIIVDRQEKQGKKTYVRTEASIKVNDYVVEILKKIKEDGEVTFEDYVLLPGYTPDFFSDINMKDKQSANSLVSLSPYVVKVYRLTEEGLDFLKQHETKN